MSKMVQIRNVPDELHRLLKARAARAGMSLSDYLLSEVRQAAERPTIEEFLERVRERPAVKECVPRHASSGGSGTARDRAGRARGH